MKPVYNRYIEELFKRASRTIVQSVLPTWVLFSLQIYTCQESAPLSDNSSNTTNPHRPHRPHTINPRLLPPSHTQTSTRQKKQSQNQCPLETRFRGGGYHIEIRCTVVWVVYLVRVRWRCYTVCLSGEGTGTGHRITEFRITAEQTTTPHRQQPPHTTLPEHGERA